MEKLATLKPVFGEGRRTATMTAGNSTPLTDGAVGRAAGAARSGRREHGLPVLAYLADVRDRGGRLRRTAARGC